MGPRQTQKAGVSRLYVKFIAVFVVLTIALIFIIFYFSFSRALIEIVPRPATVSSDFISDIETQNEELANGAMNGFLFDTEVVVTETFSATGSKDVDGNIIGQVTIHNEQNRNQPLIATTRLLTADGVLLRIKRRVDVPAGGTVEAEVYADDPSSFESIPTSDFTIPGLSTSLQKIVYAKSKTVLKSSPGSIKVVKAVDIARGKESITDKVYQKAIDSFKAEVGDDYVAVVVSKKLLDESVSSGVDDLVSDFTVEQKMSITIMGISQSDIVKIAADRLRQLVVGERELNKVVMEKLTYVVQNYNDEDKTANIKIHAEGETVLKEDSDILNKGKLAGLSSRGVELYLSSFDEIEEVNVHLTPFWVKRVPSLPDHITLKIIAQ